MPQEFLADMVGSTRSTVSRVAGTFKEEGLIEYGRGQMTLLDVPGLQRRSCECYLTIKEHLESCSDFGDDQLA